jgi:hypothetical protein
MFAADQDSRNHVDRVLWDRLVAWPPILLTPLRLQRRKKWHLFCHLLEQAACEAGSEAPLTVDFLLYAFVTGYGWPGNARQVNDFAKHRSETGGLEDRHLHLDPEFCFFDTSEAFIPADLLEAARLAHGEQRPYRNRVQRDFTRAIAALQGPGSGRAWLELAKASPGPAGRWTYPRIRWNDPHFAGAEMCARVGQAYDAALAGLGPSQERLPAADLLYNATALPWVVEGAAQRVAPGLSGVQLADLVAYGLLTGEITSGKDHLADVYDAIVRLAPDLSAQEYQRLGVPKNFLRGKSPRPQRARP